MLMRVENRQQKSFSAVNTERCLQVLRLRRAVSVTARVAEAQNRSPKTGAADPMSTV